MSSFFASRAAIWVFSSPTALFLSMTSPQEAPRSLSIAARRLGYFALDAVADAVAAGLSAAAGGVESAADVVSVVDVTGAAAAVVVSATGFFLDFLSLPLSLRASEPGFFFPSLPGLPAGAAGAGVGSADESVGAAGAAGAGAADATAVSFAAGLSAGAAAPLFGFGSIFASDLTHTSAGTIFAPPPGLPGA